MYALILFNGGMVYVECYRAPWTFDGASSSNRIRAVNYLAQIAGMLACAGFGVQINCWRVGVEQGIDNEHTNIVVIDAHLGICDFRKLQSSLERSVGLAVLVPLGPDRQPIELGRKALQQ